MATARPLRRNSNDNRQLALPLIWYSEDGFRRALHLYGATAVREVRFKRNRSNLVSLSRTGDAVNLHVCFRVADQDIVEAVATFVRSSPRSRAYREAVARLRQWWSDVADPALDARGKGAVARPSCGTPAQLEFLARVYRQINLDRFGGRLPDPPRIRLSSRMSSRFGHIEYMWRGDERYVSEIALNIDLMLAGNERHLLDTLVHEMAHVEAWLFHGHRGHGEPWRRVARRVGCDDSACADIKIRRRARAAGPITRVPRLSLVV